MGSVLAASAVTSLFDVSLLDVQRFTSTNFHPRSGKAARSGRQKAGPTMTAPIDSSNGFTWPSGARAAVVVTCLMENWSGDKGPPFSVQTTALKPGTHDRAAMTWGTYGSRNGVWRLIKILDENKVPATFVANAHSMEIAPDAVAQMLKSGHEIAAHSY